MTSPCVGMTSTNQSHPPLPCSAENGGPSISRGIQSVTVVHSWSEPQRVSRPPPLHVGAQAERGAPPANARQQDCPGGQSAFSSQDSSIIPGGQASPCGAQLPVPSGVMQQSPAHETPLHRTVVTVASGPASPAGASTSTSGAAPSTTSVGEPSLSTGDEPSPPPSVASSPELAIPRSLAPLSMAHPALASVASAASAATWAARARMLRCRDCGRSARSSR